MRNEEAAMTKMVSSDIMNPKIPWRLSRTWINAGFCLAFVLFLIQIKLITFPFSFDTSSKAPRLVKIPRYDKLVRPVALVKNDLVYGPVPKLKSLKKNVAKAKPMIVKPFNNYDFNRVKGAFYRGVKNHRISELSKRDLKNLILFSAPAYARPRLKKYLNYTLKMAEKYQVDPFWVISIMWTESHFKMSARSHVGATGLMQIMPSTGVYLARKLGITNNKKIAKRLIKKSRVNIEMGVYYLKSLLKMFNNNYKYATVGYNMGPYWVLKRLRRKLPVGTKNEYLDKVSKAYSDITAVYYSHMKVRKRPYLSTLAYRYAAPKRPSKKITWFDKTFSLFPHGVPKDVALSESKNPSSAFL